MSASTAHARPASDQPLPVALLKWRPMRKNSLLGFAEVRIGAGLIIKDVTVNTSHGKRWASMPAKPWVQPDGTCKRDDRGKVLYLPMIEWVDKSWQDRFSQGVIQAIEREHPGDLDA